jgi:hypothetical protein
MFRSILRFALSGSLVLTSLQTTAATSITGEPYLHHCEGLLEAIPSDRIAEFLVGQPQTAGQAWQLLLDYGVVASQEYVSALLLTLEKYGITFPPWDLTLDTYEPAGTWKQLRLAKRIESMSRWSDKKMKLFVTDFLKTFAKVIDASEVGGSRTRVQSLMVAQFVSAIETTSNPLVFDTLSNFIRAQLLGTARFLASKTKPVHSYDWANAKISVILTIAMGLFFCVPAYIGAVYRGEVSQISPLWLSVPFAFIVAPALLGLAMMTRAFQIDLSRAHFTNLPSGTHFLIPSGTGGGMTAATNLWSGLRSTPPPILVPMGTVCANPDLCQFSPVALAYLGYLELDEFDAMATAITQTLQTVGAAEKFAEIRKAAEGLRQNPGSLSQQLDFCQRILTAVAQMDQIEASIRTALPAIVEKTSMARQQLETLRTRMLDFSRGALANELVLRRQIIVAKLETDLAKLSEVETHEQLILARFDQFRPVLDRVAHQARDVAGQSQQVTPEQWRAAASEILVLLDSVEGSL